MLTAWLLSCARDPYVTGTSVLGITFKGGVMIAADTLGEPHTYTSSTSPCPPLSGFPYL